MQRSKAWSYDQIGIAWSDNAFFGRKTMRWRIQKEQRIWWHSLDRFEVQTHWHDHKKTNKNWYDLKKPQWQQISGKYLARWSLLYYGNMMNFGNYLFARNLPMKAKVIVVKISPALVIDWMVSKEKHLTLLTALSWGDRFQYLSMQQLEVLQLDLYCNQQFGNRDFFNNPSQRAENKDATLLVQVL